MQFKIDEDNNSYLEEDEEQLKPYLSRELTVEDVLAVARLPFVVCLHRVEEPDTIILCHPYDF